MLCLVVTLPSPCREQGSVEFREYRLKTRPLVFLVAISGERWDQEANELFAFAPPCHHLVRNRGESNDDDHADLAPSLVKTEDISDDENSGEATASDRTRGRVAKRARDPDENQRKVCTTAKNDVLGVIFVLDTNLSSSPFFKSLLYANVPLSTRCVLWYHNSLFA